MSEPWVAWPEAPKDPVSLPSVVRMSQHQLDILFERLAFWVKQTNSQESMDAYTQWRERLFTGIGATEVQVAQANSSRGLLLFSQQGGGTLGLRVTPQIGSNDGMLVGGGNSPIIITRRAHGPLVASAWWAVGAGAVNLYVLEMVK